MRGMRIRTITAPTIEPVTLEEGRLWCKLASDDTTQDWAILLLIEAMREYAEDYTGRAFAARTLEARMDCFPSREIELPNPPLRLVNYIDYVDTDGTLQRMSGSPSQWQEDIYREPGRIAPLYLESWPATYGIFDAVRISFDCGYATANEIPKRLRQWIQTRIATLYNNREQVILANIVKIPRDFADGLLDGLMLGRRLA